MEVAFCHSLPGVFVVFCLFLFFAEYGMPQPEACLLSPQRLPVEEILGVPKAEWREEQSAGKGRMPCRVHGETLVSP